MKNVATYLKITKVQAKPGKTLLVEFDNGERRVYDCKPLLDSEVFRPLEDETLFRCAHADTHGYGIVWNDAIDLAESEIWLNGQPAGPEEPSGT